MARLLFIWPVIYMAKVTAGLKWLPEMEPKLSIKAKRTKATAMAFIRTASAKSAPKILNASMVEPIAAITKNMEPTNSANRFCFSVGRYSLLEGPNDLWRIRP